MSTTRVGKKIGVFYTLTLLLSVPWYLLTSEGGTGGNLILSTGLMWSPALAAVVTKRLFGESPLDLGWAWGQARYRSLAYLIPFLYALPVYIAVWITGLGRCNAMAYVHSVAKEYGLAGVPFPLATAAYVLIAMSAGFIAKVGRALGEEIGWRGFLVPELAKVTGFTGVGLISGAMWAFWHYPLIIFSGYNAGTPTWFGMACFTVMVTAGGFIAAWLRLRSQSVWPAAFFHASHNMLIQTILTPMTSDTGKTAYLIDEFGVGIAITSVVGAVIVWRKRADLILPTPDAKNEFAARA